MNIESYEIHEINTQIVGSGEQDYRKQKLQIELPKTLKYFTNQGYTFESLPDL